MTHLPSSSCWFRSTCFQPASSRSGEEGRNYGNEMCVMCKPAVSDFGSTVCAILHMKRFQLQLLAVWLLTSHTFFFCVIQIDILIFAILIRSKGREIGTWKISHVVDDQQRRWRWNLVKKFKIHHNHDDKTRFYFFCSLHHSCSGSSARKVSTWTETRRVEV